MSLVTRLLGFGLCLLGAFTIGYVQGVQSIAGTINNNINLIAGTMGNLAPQIEALVATYIRENVAPTLNSLLAIGILMAVGGFVLVAMGDRKLRKAK